MKTNIRERQDPFALRFNDNATSRMKITRAANVNMVTGIGEYEKSAKTRYGVLSFNPETNALHFIGKPVLPAAQGNNRLSEVVSHELGKNEIVLLKNNGETACPALDLFLTINAAGVRATPELGTYSDIVRVTNSLRNSVTLVTNGFSERFRTRKEQRKAGMIKTVFWYANGLITENSH